MESDRASRMERQNLRWPAPYRAPDEGLEAAICEAFASTLGIDRVGADDEFFDLGGDSLSAEAVALAISAASAGEIRVSWLARHGTPAQLARQLSVSRPAAAAAVPVFAVHGRLGFMLPRPEILAQLAPGQELHMFELPGLRGTGDTPTTIEAIAARYVAELTARYPAGPVHLAGFCAGCLIALEMGQQLRAQGRHIALFVLGDPNLSYNTVKSLGHEAHWHAVAGWRQRLRWKLRRIALTLALGRASDGSSAADFADERVRRFFERQFHLRLSASKALAALRGRKAGRHSGLSTRPQARLLAAYSHYRPRPYDGPVQVVASPRREHLLPALRTLLPAAEFVPFAGDHNAAVAEAASLFGKAIAGAPPRIPVPA